MEECLVRKSTGECVPFDPEHIKRTLRRAGASLADIEDVLRDVRARIRNGMTTRDVASEVDRSLWQRNRRVAMTYGLKHALYRLGPAGFVFEKYLCALLGATGYSTELPEEYQGGCVKQEVDIAARQKGLAFAIEAKLRQQSSDVVDLKITLTTYARFLDLLDGAALHQCPKFDAPWVMTNGNFSDRAAKYAMCKGMKLTGWNYPEGEGLNTIIDRTGLYPLTIIRELTARELAEFAAVDILLCQQLTGEESQDIARRTGLPLSRIAELASLASEIVR